MKKTASLLALSAIAAIAWGIGQASPVRAGDNNFGMDRRAFVSFQCSIFRSPGLTETIVGIDAVGWSLPGVCTVGARCGRCADALLNDGFTLNNAFGVTHASGAAPSARALDPHSLSPSHDSSYAGPYFVFIR